MISQNERLKLLEKVAAGELTVNDAADLLNAARAEKSEPAEKSSEPERIEVVEEPTTSSIKATKHNGKAPKWLRVRVDDLQTGNRRVSVNIPIKLMKFGMKIGSRFSPELAGLNVDDLTEMIADVESGLLVEVKDEQDGEHVQIYVE